ncbi:MAG: hypothetical protein JNK08_00145 [Sediminibacterium sp.]|nr:hypothetical protein [Sediminibacterium sp.]
MIDTLKEIEQIFNDAKTNNEFQFLLTVLNYKHISSPEESSNLYEWFDALEFYKGLYHKHTGKEKVRTGLLLYSTFFENSDFYNILGSLCKNTLGFGGSSFLFWKTKKQDRLLGTGEKIRMVTEILSDCNYSNTIDFFGSVHFEQLRNTFFHSAYGFSDGDYILFDSEPLVIEGTSFDRVSMNDFLVPLIDKVILFFEKFKEQFLNSIVQYKTEKQIKGYFPDLKDIIIHGTENGLKGVTIQKTAQLYGEWVDSGIYYNENYKFWFAKNIQFNFPRLEKIEIDESLTRYESKNDIKNSNSEFFNLVDKIVEINIKDQMERIISLLIKFGDAKYQLYDTEANELKKRSLKKLPLPFYQKAIQLNKHLDIKTIIKRTKELEE